jgi:nucleoside-diphosphate-sugar epimerase
MAGVLIAGCGYVGGALGSLLAASGHVVHGLRRNTAALPAGVHPLAFDLASDDPAGLEHDFEFVVYAVGASAHEEAAYRDAYVRWPLRLLRALAQRAAPPRRVIYVSSTGVYHQDDGEWVDEESPAASGRFSGRVLLEGEAAVRAVGLPLTVVRLSGIYGPGRTRLIDSVRGGTAVCVAGDKAILNHIHRDDAAGAIAHVLRLASPAALYLGTDCAPVPRCVCLDWIAEQLGCPRPRRVEREAVASGGARGGHRRYSNARLLGSGYRFIYPTFREGYGALL